MKNTAFVMKRPSVFWLMTEAVRAVTELGVSYPYQKIYNKTPKGDGHPVLILPGFLASKHSTKVLRNFVNKAGYTAYDWGIERNWGKIEYLPFLIQRIEELHQKHNQQVTLIGWSLGGVFARQIAKERPNLTRQIITLGSPFLDIAKPNNIAWLHTLLNGGKTAKELHPHLLTNLPLPAPVPTTAIYSKEDGIVPWKACMEKEVDHLHQNIQVHGSHCGLGMNSSVLHIIADRLQYSKENWQHFEAKGYFEGLFLYPSL